MPFFERGDIRIYYESHGEGFPVLALALPVVVVPVVVVVCHMFIT